MTYLSSWNVPITRAKAIWRLTIGAEVKIRVGTTVFVCETQDDLIKVEGVYNENRNSVL
jgi:hypothetical protein